MPDFCLISTASRAGHATATVMSILAHHPDARIWLLELTPVRSEPCDALGRTNVTRLSLADIGITQDQLWGIRAGGTSPQRYVDSIKPWLLQHVLRETRCPVTLLADDIVLFGPLQMLSALAASNGVVLVARAHRALLSHVWVPLPKPITPGAIDLDVMVIGTAGDSFLRDWQSHLLSRGTAASPSSQEFVDGSAGQVGRPILWDPGYNCGYWNLTGLFQLSAEGKAEVGGVPISLLHLHGFDAQRPHVLTTEFEQALPVRLSQQPDLARFCRDYAQAVRSRRISDVPGDSVLTRERLPSGLPIDRFMKELWRTHLKLADVGVATPPPDPFHPHGEPAFIEWLNSPRDSSSGGLSLYLSAIYDARPDLQLAFPTAVANPSPLWRWASIYGREELAIPGSLIPRRHAAHAFRQTHSEVLPGIGANVIGLLTAELGLGEAARLLLEAFRASGIPYRAESVNLTESPHTRVPPTRNSHLAPFAVNVICMNPPELIELRRRVGPEFFEGRYNVGVWAWETETLPASWQSALRWVDEVWVPSQYTHDVVSRASTKPVFVIPSPMIAPQWPSYMDRAYFGLPERFTFLFMFDFFSSVWRKNPVGLIEAFKSAFAPDEGPCLVVKSMNGHLRLDDQEEVLCAAAGRPDVFVIDRYLLPDERRALLAASNCYVSLHHAEGFGLTMAEAMALGKPVIATGYSGNLQFMTEENSWLVGAERVPVGREWDRYPPGDYWADPDLAHAAALLRHVWEDPESTRSRACRGQMDIERLLAPGVIGDLVKRRLQEVAPMATRRQGTRFRRSAPRVRNRASRLARTLWTRVR